ncbi:MAG: 3-dehydroquinate synthase [Gammaproteobacteria bacterium]|jgi:3-dehydroquinate synthase|nr:MAG: 3-dehydroquinate synthase [Gammaproteobacteria bacterium]
MKEMQVSLGDRSYPLFIGEDLLGVKDLWARICRRKQVMVVSNRTVAPLYLDQVMTALSGCNIGSVTLEDGEKYKTLDALNAVITRLLELGFSRDCLLVALGGGVIGDITGFAAACYQRGVDYIQVPTTLLAQVDSSVGGKTAVNHALGKNMIGVFYQPVAVLADTRTLATLPDRELRAGLAEVIKYGIIRDQAFFAWLEENLDGLLARDQGCLAHAIEQSCRNKAEIVSLDETEQNVRALLNFGHTFGHAIETATAYTKFLHGEAVAIGMLMAADVSCRHGWLTRESMGRLKRIQERAGLPLVLPAGLAAETLRSTMAIDKKARSARLFLVLLHEIGAAFLTDQYEEKLLAETLSEFGATGG